MTDDGLGPRVTPPEAGGGDRTFLAIVIGSVALALLIILALAALALVILR